MPTIGEWAVIIFLVYMVLPVALYLLWVTIKAIWKPIQKRRKEKARQQNAADNAGG